LVKPEMKDEFENDKCNWFPRTDTTEHARYDKRKQGLFKVEWEGAGIVSLCSKHKVYVVNIKHSSAFDNAYDFEGFQRPLRTLLYNIKYYL
jgi:hypothetical protein